MQWGDHWYGTNNDHDAQVLYYRRDIIEDPKWQAAFKEEMGHDMPVKMDTWDDVLEIAQFFNKKDWNGDGDPDDGITLHLKVGGQGFFHFMALSAPYVVIPYPGDPPTKVTKYHNVYWFDPETMEPLINSPGHVAALEMLLKLSKAGSRSHVGLESGRGVGGLPVRQRGPDVLVGRRRLAVAGSGPVGDPGQAGCPRYSRHQVPV
jgi:multiple sugar transport system substrate-binding protein